MPADGAWSRICGFAFAVELHERAAESHVFSRSVAIIPFEGGYRFGRHIGAASRQFGIHRIAEVLRALDSVCEIRTALQIATIAVPRRNRAKRTVRFADNVKAAREPTGARGVHGEVAGILNCTFAQFFQVKRSRPLQNYLCDLAFAFADMRLQPSGDACRLLHGKRSGRTRHGHDDVEADDTD